MYTKKQLSYRTILTAAAILLSSILMQSCGSISNLNYGLKEPQDSATLPKSSVKPQMPVKKAKKTPVTELKKEIDGTMEISGGWELIEASKIDTDDGAVSLPGFNTSNWYNATVPGTVLTTLVDQGVYPDPYYSLNNLAIPENLCRQEWWYRTSFKYNPQSKNTWLTFNGINYMADIWLNGRKLGKIEGAFKRGVFNISGVVDPSGENILAVHIYPPLNPGIPHEESPSAGRGPNGGVLCLDGPTFISSEGWDWIPGIRDRNIGIWQDVVLKSTGTISITNPQVVSVLPLPDTTSAVLTINAVVSNSDSVEANVIVKGKIENIEFSKEVTVPAGKTIQVSFTPEEFKQLTISNPRLWWPNGYGSPELYKLELSALVNNNVSDVKSVSFGIRQFTYEIAVNSKGENHRIEFDPVNNVKNGKLLFDNIDRTDVENGVVIPKLRDDIDIKQFKEIADDPMGSFLVIKVNGKRIFCRGGNWGMDDGMKRVSRERLEPYFQLHRDAHFNMIRNWTGESTEEVFYTLADEYGMLVWNDFWMSTEGYNVEPENEELFLANLEETVKRFRNHPSIAVWCPRNEGFAPKSMEERIAGIIASEDITRYYQPNSRYMNLTPSGPWDYFTDPAEYFRSNARGFNTELGTPSVPTAATMRSMMPESDVWPISDNWYYHDLHWGQKDYLNAIEKLYGKSGSVEDFCTKAQMVNYESHRAMFEAWNSKLWNNTSGVLLWMSHPAWPSTVWQTYSWDYETFGSYYGAQKACEPVHIQMNLNDNKIVIINTTLHPLKNLTARLLLYSLDGKQLFEEVIKTDADADKLTDCFIPDFPAGLPDVYLARLILSNEEGVQLSVNDYWKSSRDERDFLRLNALPEVLPEGKILGVISGNKQQVAFKITNNAPVPAVSIKLNLVDKDGRIILPAFCSDGYFNLVPGESRNIIFTCDKNVKEPYSILIDGYNIIKGSKINIK